MTRLLQTRVGRTTVRVRPAAPRGIVGCKAQCRRDYRKDRAARIQCYRTCKEFNTGRAFNGGITGPAGAVRDGPECQPAWPDLPPGANLTIDPSRPPPTTQQVPFCDWPSSSCLADVASYPPVQATAPPHPRLSNAARRRRYRLGTRPSVRGIPSCRDAGCCNAYCVDKFPTSAFLYKSCMKTCNAVNRIGTPPRAVRLRNQNGLRFATAAREVAQLTERRIS